MVFLNLIYFLQFDLDKYFLLFRSPKFYKLTSSNLKSNIKLLKDGIEKNSTYLQDIITLNVSFNEEIYYPNGIIIDNIQKETMNNNNYNSFNPLNLSKNVGLNECIYKIQVKWNNLLDKAILDEIYLEIKKNFINPSNFNWIWIISIILAITIPILTYVLLKRKKIKPTLDHIRFYPDLS